MNASSKWRQLPGLVRTAVAPRRYADQPTPPRLARPRAVQVVRNLLALPRELRAVPPLPKDTGAGYVVRHEHGAWVIRPANGWRAHLGRPLHVNRDLQPHEHDAATEWALRVFDRAG